MAESTGRTNHTLRLGQALLLAAMELEIVRRARRHGTTRLAIVDRAGQYTYPQLLEVSERIAAAIGPGGGTDRPSGAAWPVAFLVTPGFAWVATQWGIWQAGGMAVPLATSHPPAELEYVIADSGAELVITDEAHLERVAAIGARLGLDVRTVHEILGRSDRPAVPGRLRPAPADDSALVFYTSGTTGKPKGVVLTHANLEAQIRSLVTAWEWRPDDVILNVLPLHHVHGVVNVVGCALWSGATCEFARVDADGVWRRFVAGGLTLFMAVPTIYARLIAAFEAAGQDQQAAMRAACRGFRLMVSGSAALPVRVLERWREISGHVLLERYGMTEIGMALSNPMHGVRRPGHVGQPLPGVAVRVVDDAGRPVPAGVSGEIEVQGPTVFREYLGQPDATAKAFRAGWFRTGDIGIVEGDSYRILGRKSVDIIKSGGYKLSALEIEEVLREHPAIAECAVVGLPDEEYGERVAAAVVLHPGAALELADLRPWARERLAGYKVPTRLMTVGALPRNAMGKVIKPDVLRLFA
jgi:malonyl-CoA/methylmalonyl-CoA synthetase